MFGSIRLPAFISEAMYHYQISEENSTLRIRYKRYWKEGFAQKEMNASEIFVSQPRIQKY